jgi:BolA family transcriptional regulator, general stress-responsive regulator
VSAPTPAAARNRAVLEQLRAALQGALAPRSLEILDDSARHAGHAGAASGGHYKVTLVAEAFRGRSQLERHRLVYQAAAALMQHGVHALNIVARAPDE